MDWYFNILRVFKMKLYIEFLVFFCILKVIKFYGEIYMFIYFFFIFEFYLF